MEFLNEISKKCTGCGACANACPNGSIHMREDVYGFLRAEVDETTCVKCGKCKDTCPQVGFVPQSGEIQLCFSAKANDSVRQNSSSGGIFYVMAERIIKRGGFVFGAAYASATRVSHVGIDNMESMPFLQKSKYVQSDTKKTFQEVQRLLEENAWVLYSGCPCQIAGLKKFLGKEYDKLVLVDIICKGVPSSKCLEDILEKYVALEDIESIDFRNKTYGWNCDYLTVSTKSKEKIVLSAKTGVRSDNYNWFIAAFLEGINTNDACMDCKYAELPRVGDITIGDFWGIWELDYDIYDRLGTSFLLVNSGKGLKLIGETQDHFSTLKMQVIEKAIKYNRFVSKISESKKHRRFWDNYACVDTLDLIKEIIMEKYDVGLVGLCSSSNQGAALLTYATYRFLEDEGYSTLLIQQHDEANWRCSDVPFFVRNPYPDYSIAEHAKNKMDMIKYNERCDFFVLGSDQLLASFFYKNYGSCFALDWVYDMKKKIGYALSFSRDYPVVDSDMDLYEMQNNLQRFDFISSREDTGCKVLKRFYGIDAELTIDPVLLQNECFYNELIEGIRFDDSGYILSAIWHVSKNKFANLHNCFKGDFWKNIVEGDHEISGIIKRYGGVDTVHCKVEEWILHIKNAELVVTDSYHCTIMSIIYKRDFICICSEEDSPTRLISLLRKIGLESRIVTDSYNMYKDINMLRDVHIDYVPVYERLNAWIEDSKRWFRNALEYKKTSTVMTDMDVLKKNIYDKTKENIFLKGEN